MRNQTKLMIGIFLFILNLPFEAFCQPDEKWKERNDKGNRYEGKISMKVRRPLIELISFYSFKEEYTQDSILKVRFYLHDNFHVYLVAQELERREYYWMEAKPQKWRIGWNEFGPWPVAQVLGRYEIPAGNLGILIRLFEKEPYLEGGSGYISPAILYHSSLPSEARDYTAYFMPGKSFSGGSYEIYKGLNGGELLVKGLVGRQSARVAFPVKFCLPRNWQGLVRFKIIVNIINEGTSSHEYYFYHIPIVKNQKFQ